MVDVEEMRENENEGPERPPAEQCDKTDELGVGRYSIPYVEAKAKNKGNSMRHIGPKS